MPFKNPPTDLRLPDDETTIQFIFLDGETGEITIVGTSGSKIVISPNEINPSIRFYSPDGSNDAFINAVNFGIPTVSDLGVNSGRWTPPDGVERRGRLYLNTNSGGGLGTMEFAIIKALTQVILGGWVVLQSNGLWAGYKDADAAIEGALSAVRSGNTVNINLYSGKYTPADGVQRRVRLLMQPTPDFHHLAVIKASNDAVKGGWIQLQHNTLFVGYKDADAAIDDYIQFFNGGAVLDTSGDFTVNANKLVVNGGLRATGNDSPSTTAGADELGFTDTLYTQGATVVGTSFVAPPSGKVLILWHGRIESNTVGVRALLSIGVRTGSTLGSGGLVSGAADGDAVETSTVDVAGTASRLGASSHRMLTGLTPGNTYNVVTEHKVSAAGNGDIFDRMISVVPMV